MRKWIIAAIVIAALAGCASKDTQEAAPVEDKGTGTTAHDAGYDDHRRGGTERHRHRDRRQPRAQGSDQHPVAEAQRLLRLRPVRRSRTSTSATVEAHAKYLQANRSLRVIAAGQHRRARHARVQHRARPAARRRGEEADAAARRDRGPDRDGELRQGKAAARRPRRDVVGGESPRRHRLRRRVDTQLRAPVSPLRRARARRARAPRARRALRRRRGAQADRGDQPAADADPEAARDRIAALESQLKSQGLVELFNQVEQLKSDVARLRGQIEVLTYEQEQQQKRQRDLYVDLDTRLRKLEGRRRAPPPGTRAPKRRRPRRRLRHPSPWRRAGTDEQRAYDAALDQFKAGSYGAAIAGFPRSSRRIRRARSRPPRSTGSATPSTRRRISAARSRRSGSWSPRTRTARRCPTRCSTSRRRSSSSATARARAARSRISSRNTRSPTPPRRRSSGSARAESAESTRAVASPRASSRGRSAHGRHDLPWQGTRDPYRIWLSEIMLQQTQVATVVPYYERFVAAFPDVRALAAAPEDRVLEHWSGLGYYRRAHHLHAAAKADRRASTAANFRATRETIATLPGIGRSTAAAIAAFAFGARAAILDGNVKRVLARHRGIAGWPGAPKVEAKLWRRGRVAAAARGRRDVHAGADGPRRDGVHAQARRAAMRVRSRAIASRASRIASPSCRRRGRRRCCRSARCACSCSSAPARSCSRSVPRPASGAGCGACRSCRSTPTSSRIACALRCGASSRARELAPIEHGFTHYRLTILPQRVARALVAAARGSARVSCGSRARTRSPRRCRRRSARCICALRS